jgi:hypothetical protein
MQIPGAGVVPESLPRLANLARMRARQLQQRGETIEEPSVKGDDARDLCLLEHQL